MESFINNFLPSLLSHFYPGTVWTPCQFPESILHSHPPFAPLYFLPLSLLTPSVHRNNVHVKTIIPTLCHTLTRCVYHRRAGGSKAISSWCECCIPPHPDPLSHSQSLMAPLALQTSDLISDISAVIATGTSLHPATSSASAGYFCWEVAGTWQAQQKAAQTKGARQLHALGSMCVEIIAEPAGSTSSTLRLSQHVAIFGFASHIHRPPLQAWLQKKNSHSNNFMTPSIMAVCCASSPGRLCLVAAAPAWVCALNRWTQDMI